MLSPKLQNTEIFSSPKGTMSRVRLVVRENKSGSDGERKSECGTPNHSGEVDQKSKNKTRTTPKSEPSILKDMIGLPYSDNIKQHANSIFNRFNSNKTYRSQRRVKLIFYCIYNAHKELDLNVNPTEVAIAVGMDPRNCSKALSLFSEVETGYRPPQISSTPQHFLPGYCDKLEIKDEEAFQAIMDLAGKILRKEPALREKSPQKIAAGILKYWMDTNGVKIKEEDYARVVRQSPTTIKSIVNEIEVVDNR